MKSNVDDLEAVLLLKLQSGLPLTVRPFLQLGEMLGLTEEDILGRVRALFDSGTARRFGAVFDARSLGYDSTLCAADVPTELVERIAAPLIAHVGVTHCYEREGRPNLWFTLTSPREQLSAELDRIAASLSPRELLNLPARRTFKIKAVFDTRLIAGQPDPEASPSRTDRLSQPTPLDEKKRTVVRRLQGSIPLVPEPFAVLAEKLGYTPDEFLALLVQWQRSGILRRMGLIVRHRQLGFAANGMCVWNVDAKRIAGAGIALANCVEVTHCYERIPHALFPFNLFAMIHAASRESAALVRDRVSTKAGLNGGTMMLSARELKKSSPRFFEEK